jgi:hypothetical protein
MPALPVDEALAAEAEAEPVEEPPVLLAPPVVAVAVREPLEAPLEVAVVPD